ncbi:MAG: DUF4349 domain-containing protein [Candidatus Gracilibacteria bacterium]|jgi:hypothetical protein
MKYVKLALIMLFLLVFSGCSNPFRSVSVGSAGEYDMAMAPMAESFNGYGGETKMMADAISADSAYSPEVDRKLIKNGSLGLHVEDVRDSAKGIQVYADTISATVSDLNITRGENSYSGYLTLRVPAEKFDSSMESLKGMALYIESEYSNTNDVTEAYMDLEMRLESKQKEEERYLNILDTSGTMTEILAATQALSNVQYEIERLKGQIQSYDNQVSYSTISVSLYEDENIATTSEAWSPESTWHNAMSDWVAFLQGSVDFVIYLALFGWPIVLLVIVAWVLIRRRDKKRK